MRWVEGYTTKDRLDQLYERLQSEYRFYIRQRDVASLGDFRASAREYEEVNRQRREREPTETRTPDPSTAATSYDREACCWRCKQRGHTRQPCQRPSRKFCSRCGRDGLLTRECNPLAGNDRGTVDAATGS